MSEARDIGLRTHRILQWFATVGTLALTGWVGLNYQTWERMKENAVRMENVPSDIREIKNTMNDISRSIDNHSWRLLELEKPKRK